MKVDYAEILSDNEMFEAFKKSSNSVRNEVVDHIYHSIKKCLIERGVFEEKLHASLFIGLCESFGGLQVYLPSGKHLFKVLEELVIFKEFNGKNQNELALKYRVSNRSIASIVERQRKFQKMARDSLEGIGIKHA
ncbi:Mor transcription activator family protein [Aeromonas hydrophila]